MLQRRVSDVHDDFRVSISVRDPAYGGVAPIVRTMKGSNSFSSVDRCLAENMGRQCDR
jgi:hypothetical protein